MKRTFYIIVGTALMLLFSGCFNQDKIADELIKYHNNEWKILQEMKEDKVKADTSEYILLAMEGNNKEVGKLLKEKILPSHNEVVEYLEGTKLKNKEIEELNQLQIDAEEFRYKVLQEQADVFSSGEKVDFEAMFERFERHDKELEEKYKKVDDKREELIEKYDVHWVDVYDEDGEPIRKMERKEFGE